MSRITRYVALASMIGIAFWSTRVVAQGFSDRGKFAAPKDIKLRTKDGVLLGITYYASSEGSEAVPVVLLHDTMESRAVFNSLAEALRDPGTEEMPSLAVVTVDFRGHGDSKMATAPNGRTFKLDAARLQKADYQAMVNFDMEAVRKFLVTKNDAGELNLNKLCLVGSGLGANVAVYWTVKDWNTPPLAIGKQGQDVKALVLVSPKWNYRGLPLVKPMKHPAIQRNISMLLVCGAQDSKAARGAKNIYKILKKFHPEPPRDELREKKALFFVGLGTSLQGTKLLTAAEFKMLPNLRIFINDRLVQKDFEWSKRRSN